MKTLSMLAFVVSSWLFAADAQAQAMQRSRSATAAPATSAPAPAVIDRSAATQMGGAGVLNMMTRWERLPGCARRISIAALTQIYVTGCADTRDTLIYHFAQERWDDTASTGVNVAAVSDPASPSDLAGTLRAAGAIPISSTAIANGAFQELAVGGGWMWAIQPPSGDHWGGYVMRTHCVKLSAGDCKWTQFGSIYMKRIAAGLTDAVAWAVGEDGRIYRQVNQGDGWIEKPGCATAIANGGGDTVWVIGCDEPDAEGNRGIYHWVGESFERVAGIGKEIAVQSDGKPWVVTGDGGIWRLR